MSAFPPIKERLMAKVEKRADTGCWVWTGTMQNSKGYGSIYYDRKNERVHRVSYKLFIGPIPDGLFVLHRCDNPPCINPEHLFLGTPMDNTRDCLSKGRFPGQKATHCVHGHEYTKENTIISRHGRRSCRECYRQYKRNLYYRKKNEGR